MNRKKILSVLVGFTLCITQLAAGHSGKAAKSADSASDSLETFTPDNLNQYAAPEWYQDAKFGIFVHWGVYSVPAYGDEWYGHWMYTPNSKSWAGDDIYTYNQQNYSGMGYKDFISQFKAESFNPDNWAKLFKDAGANYVVPVAIHHDSFAMYDSDVTRWNSVDMGPKRDVIGLLKQAVKKQGMKFGISNHFAENWWFFPHVAGLDTSNPQYSDLYNPGNGKDTAHIQKWQDLSKEEIDKYNPDILWYDFGIGDSEFQTARRDIAAYYYNNAKINNKDGVALNYKYGAFNDGEAVFDVERGGLSEISSKPWQSETSISNKSWGYITNDTFKTADNLIASLSDIVSKNGRLLLNIGPKADGTIPQQETDVLLSIGSWLKINGEAIYNTRPWITYGEGPTVVAGGSFSDNTTFTAQDIRFTRSKDKKTLYAIAMAKPASDKMVIKTLNSTQFDASTITGISLLGGDNLSWTQDTKGLNIDLSKAAHQNRAFAVKISFSSEIPSVQRNAQNKIEAETYDTKSSALNEVNCPADGSMALSSSTEGTSSYKLDFGIGASTVLVNTATNSSSNPGSVELRLDSETGPVIGTVTASGTGSYSTQSATLAAVANITGSHQVYLIYKGDISVNWFYFVNRILNMQISAGNFDAKSGTVAAENCEAEGGLNLGLEKPGDYVFYKNVNLGSGAAQLKARVAGDGSGGIEVRIADPSNPSDVTKSTLIGTIPATNTSGWGNWWVNYVTVSTALSGASDNLSGIHDLYLVFKGNLNIRWFNFTNPTTNDAPVAWYKFDETSGNSATDSSNNGFTGTMIAPGKWISDGKFGGALDFNTTDTDSKIDLGTNEALQPEALTVSYWIKRTGEMNGAESRVFWFKQDGNWASNGWSLGTWDINSAGNVLEFVADGGRSLVLQTGRPDDVFPLNKWVHIAVTFNPVSHQVTYYKNGLKVTTKNYINSITATKDTKYIGTNSPLYGNALLKAALDDVRIYNRALSDEEIVNIVLNKTDIPVENTTPGGAGTGHVTETDSSTEKTADKPEANPATGDSGFLGYVMLFAVSGLGAFLFRKRRIAE